MDATKLSQLREMAEDGNGEVDRGLVLELIQDHESQQRAESFWSVRAPAMVDEIERLRKVESHARAMSMALAALADPASNIGEALQELDALRSQQAAA